ncbi:hypothetical protein CBD81_002230 [bacterium TMED221]|nr:MAG: hypothetical protein CBD81_002230 [bacterium TMED221]
MDKKFFLEAPNLGLEYIKSLEKEEKYTFFPSKKGLTNYGERLSLGFSCLALKVFYMTGEWQDLKTLHKEKWVQHINSFQVEDSKFPKNSYLDPVLINSYTNLAYKENIKYILKRILSISPNFNYDSKNVAINKAINAETKQAVSTLHEVGYKNNKEINKVYSIGHDISYYLNTLDWSKPWSSGAQFASMCVFSETQGLNLKSELQSFIKKISDKETGSYFKEHPKSNREVINGAMKVISGLDWLETEIHNPKKLIDFCLNNKPILEGCDVVDYVYVLYKCSNQENYRKKEIVLLFDQILNDIKKLYVADDGGFSYFIGKSQTHYYGVEITKGLNSADIHSTTLCIWALIMILDTLEMKNSKMNIIKP